MLLTILIMIVCFIYYLITGVSLIKVWVYPIMFVIEILLYVFLIWFFTKVMKKIIPM